LSGKVLTGRLSDYWALYRTLESGNLKILGVDFISDIRQAESRSPVEWRVYQSRPSTLWPSENQAQNWRKIANSAYNEKMGHLWDLASRISHQIRVCSWRLREISEAYYHQLNAQVLNGFKSGNRFDNVFVWRSYVAVQAFLVDACILRDYLSEFAAQCHYGRKLGMAKVEVTTAASLKKLLANVPDSDELTVSLRTATDDNGWLQTLGHYRDLVLHLAPLSRAKSRLFAGCETLIFNSENLPYVTCPIPDNPHKIMESRNRGDFFVDFTSQWETFVKAATEGFPSQDALTYCYGVLGNLTALAESLSEHSPVVPKMMLFEMIDETQAEMRIVD
jgi:hypothetical protein